MKNKIYKTFILTLCMFATVAVAQAQFPNFTKVDTGVITQLWGGHGASTCFDMDNDGDQDLFVGNSAVGVNRMFSIFKNERNGLYMEMPELISDYNMLSSHGDIDNDGDVDIITGMPTNEVYIYTNNGYGTFQFNTFFYLWYPVYYPTLLDLNNDGFLDVLGINRQGSINLNDGNGGFLGTSGLGFFQTQLNVYLHGVSWGDPDNDGDFDFYGGYTADIGSSGNPVNICYLNDGNTWFTQFDPSSPIVEGACTTPSVNWVDYDNDGDMDIYVHNIWSDNILPALYENLGNMEFTKHEIIDEIYRHSFSNSSVWGDLDNDGDLDLFLTVENNDFPWPPPYTSATPYNVLYLNEGNNQFTDVLEHTLTLEDSHTALLLDHDNDGDLDVLMTRYSWSSDGYNNLFINEGNDNSWMVLTCEGTTSNRSAIGTRVQAKCFVNGNHITQTREITPVNGHLSYANLRVHFGMGDTDIIDTLLIRWPSGIVDTYLDVEANQFYRAVENEMLDIDFKATNYIAYTPSIIANSIEQSTIINLNEHFHLMLGDTVPQITGDTIIYSLYSNGNPGIVQTEVNGSFIILRPLAIGETTIEILASAGFTEKLVSIAVNVIDLPPSCLMEGITFSTQEQIDGFQSNYPGCIQIAGDMEINGNDIDDLSGLGVISSVEGNLKIISNDLLADLTGLESLIFIDGNLEIIGNPLLSNISGLSNIEPATIDNLSIFFNNSLSECHIVSICEYLNDFSMNVDIHDNATGCNSQDDVMELCGNIQTLSGETDYVDIFNIFPNPFQSKVVISYTLKENSSVNLKIFDLRGKEIVSLLNEFQQPGKQKLIFNTRDLLPGTYFIVLSTNPSAGGQTKKIIKL